MFTINRLETPKPIQFPYKRSLEISVSCKGLVMLCRHPSLNFCKLDPIASSRWELNSEVMINFYTFGKILFTGDRPIKRCVCEGWVRHRQTDRQPKTIHGLYFAVTVMYFKMSLSCSSFFNYSHVVIHF